MPGAERSQLQHVGDGAVLHQFFSDHRDNLFLDFGVWVAHRCTPKQSEITMRHNQT